MRDIIVIIKLGRKKLSHGILTTTDEDPPGLLKAVGDVAQQLAKELLNGAARNRSRRTAD